MNARLIVFPVKGRNWCFSRSGNPSAITIESESHSARSSSTLRDLWKKISSNGKPVNENAELVVDFISDKMNRAWIGFERAPAGSLKNKIHGLGLRLLSGVKPSEILLKSISKDVKKIEITYPKSLNPRLGSERLLLLVSDGSATWNPVLTNDNVKESSNNDFDCGASSLLSLSWVLQPSEELDKLIRGQDPEDGLSECVVSDICKRYNLDINEVLKYRNSV